MDHCAICGEEIWEDDYWRFINGAGESTLGKARLYNEDYILCPRCAAYIYLKIGEKREEMELENSLK